ncbi:MAG: THUMP domain-containing protein, partial [Bacillota bacterium]|nr:THUMP domain-containing protein [Bacillota bacterium]
MNYERILIRYGEISTKGRNRKIFVDKLKKSIQRALVAYKEIEIEANRDRIYILLNGADWDQISPILRTIFGIQSFSPGIKVALDIDEMKTAALELVSSHFKKGQTFKITGKRADKSFELNTDEINHTFGSHLLKSIPGLKVDVNTPDINLQIEVRKEAAYLSC